MNEPTPRCEYCGASMKAFWHSLSSGLVSALVKAIIFVRANNKNEFHLQRDLSTLTKNEYNNFQKLRFHGLVAKMEEKAGYWLITGRGGQFLRGEIEIPARVQTFRNKIIGKDTKLVGIWNFKNKVPYFESEFAYEYQQSDIISQSLF